MQPVRLPSSLTSGTSSGCASPNVRRQRATVSAKSARACSSLVTATARGLSIAAHSRHNSRVASSISSFGRHDEQDRVGGAQTGPHLADEVGVPGVSSRLITHAPLATEAAARECDGLGSPRTWRFGKRAAISRSNRADFPAPAGPTRTTLRICSGDLGSPRHSRRRCPWAHLSVPRRPSTRGASRASVRRSVGSWIWADGRGAAAPSGSRHATEAGTGRRPRREGQNVRRNTERARCTTSGVAAWFGGSLDGERSA